MAILAIGNANLILVGSFHLQLHSNVRPSLLSIQGLALKTYSFMSLHNPLFATIHKLPLIMKVRSDANFRFGLHFTFIQRLYANVLDEF